MTSFYNWVDLIKLIVLEFVEIIYLRLKGCVGYDNADCRITLN
jgi:hypothetical protein